MAKREHRKRLGSIPALMGLAAVSLAAFLVHQHGEDDPAAAELSGRIA